MVTLEQVRLLEAKVARAIEFVNRVTGENILLKEKVAGYQNRIDELEVLVQRFKEDQSRIEEGILSALDRLNQFEDAIEREISGTQAGPVPPRSGNPPKKQVSAAAESRARAGNPDISPTPAAGDDSRSSGDDSEEDIMAALEAEEAAAKAAASGSSSEQAGELDIF